MHATKGIPARDVTTDKKTVYWAGFHFVWYKVIKLKEWDNETSESMDI